jgi:hypothetical protein
MTDVAVEEARELGGLLIVMTWMVVLTVTALRKRNGLHTESASGDNLQIRQP